MHPWWLELGGGYSLAPLVARARRRLFSCRVVVVVSCRRRRVTRGALQMEKQILHTSQNRSIYYKKYDFATNTLKYSQNSTKYHPQNDITPSYSHLEMKLYHVQILKNRIEIKKTNFLKSNHTCFYYYDSITHILLRFT